MPVFKSSYIILKLNLLRYLTYHFEYIIIIKTYTLFRYGKAFGRLGLAYSIVDKHKEAVECFKRAIELEPENESYKTNLKLAEEKLNSVGSPGLRKLLY